MPTTKPMIMGWWKLTSAERLDLWSEIRAINAPDPEDEPPGDLIILPPNKLLDGNW